MLDKFIPPFVELVRKDFDEKNHRFWLAGNIKEYPVEKSGVVYIGGDGLGPKIHAYVTLVMQLHAARAASSAAASAVRHCPRSRSGCAHRRRSRRWPSAWWRLCRMTSTRGSCTPPLIRAERCGAASSGSVAVREARRGSCTRGRIRSPTRCTGQFDVHRVVGCRFIKFTRAKFKTIVVLQVAVSSCQCAGIYDGTERV